MIWAAAFLAAALLLGGRPAVLRMPVRSAADEDAQRLRPPRRGADDPLAAASSFDLLSACLSAGMAVSQAAAATAPAAPAELARQLNRAAGLLALGADPAVAWSDTGPSSDPNCVALLRLARRSASSGAALAAGVAELAAQSRHDAADAAAARAERAGVLIAGPLGLCYLPAFVCLGIVPVVAGLAGEVLRSGVV